MNRVDRGELLQRSVEDLPDCAVFILDVEGRVLTWNAGACSILGYVAEEIVGQPLARLYAGRKGAPAEAMADALVRGRHEETARLVRKDGTALDVLSVLIPLYDAREQHVGFGNLSRDLAVGVSAGMAGGAGRRISPFVAVPSRSWWSTTTAQGDPRRCGAPTHQPRLPRDCGAGRRGGAGTAAARIRDVDLLLVDVMMPNGMDGREVRRAGEGHPSRPQGSFLPQGPL